MKPRTTCKRCGRSELLLGWRTLCCACRLAAYVAANRKVARTRSRHKVTRKTPTTSVVYSEAAE